MGRLSGSETLNIISRYAGLGKQEAYPIKFVRFDGLNKITNGEYGKRALAKQSWWPVPKKSYFVDTVTQTTNMPDKDSLSPEGNYEC